MKSENCQNCDHGQFLKFQDPLMKMKKILSDFKFIISLK